ncbi:hypothetical protein EKO04_003453 [Ascochyta lentis]|uniref:Uncharacterized protein n=1 Tax=Ascochyta lentis TaxID=205686 RepID=A0A8H7J7E5_9PLEO|nr:hypothetical protein EKO04_003453 [Ascochyta lentis]
MANRDYAAGIDPKRRISLWGKITNGLQLETDWDSAPPLTAGLRESFPDLLPGRLSVNAPPVPTILQPGRHATADPVNSTRNLRTGERSQRDLPRTIILGGVSYQRSVHRRPSQRVRPQQNPHQQKIFQPVPDHDLFSAATPHGRVHSVVRNGDLYEDPRSAPAPPSCVTVPHLQQQQEPNRDLDQHNTTSPHLPVAHPGHQYSRTRTVRRIPAQSSLRNQVSRDNNHRTSPHQPSTRAPHTTTTLNHTIPTTNQSGGYSHYPSFSPLPQTAPHPLLPPSSNRTSSAAIHARQHPWTNHPTVPELQGSSFLSPPLPPCSQSNLSIATFENLNNPVGPPMSKCDANMQALKMRILAPWRSWRAKVSWMFRG